MEIILKYFSDFSPTQIDQFNALGPLYKEWNEKINVISRKDIDGLYEKHVLHSLSIAAVFDFQAGSDILDLGTGGGFPGIPLAIFFPDVHFLLVDSIGKKLKVVEAIAKDINLQNISIRHVRAEDIRDKKFDFVVSRAVAPLGDLWKWSKSLLRTGHAAAAEADRANKGHSSANKRGLICLKGGDLANEIQLSGVRPYVTDIYDIFPEEYFREKYILHVPR